MLAALPTHGLGIHLLDWLVVVVYLIGITALGTWAIRKVKSSSSFFISDRKSGKLMMMFFNFGTGTHSDQAVSVASKTYSVGASGIWYQLFWVFPTPFYWLIAPMFRRMRAVTTGDYFEARFDRGVAVLYAIMGIINLIVNIGVMLCGAAAIVTAVSGGQIPREYAIVAMTVMFGIYGIAGGLNAAIVTDFIQGLLTIVLSFIILPFALSAVDGMSGLREKVDEAMTVKYEQVLAEAEEAGHPGVNEHGQTIEKTDMFTLVAPGEITLFFIVIVSLNGLVGFGTQPHTMGMCGAGKTEMESRVGLTCGIFFKRFCTIAWALTGLCAVAIYAGQDPAVEGDEVYGLMASKLLWSGLVGLFIASMLAAVMSSCDAFMVGCSALFTENIYRKCLVPRASDRHYMLVGRYVAALVAVAGVLFALSLEDVVQGLEVFWKVSAVMGMVFWAGLFWRRTTTAGAWAGTLVTFASLLVTSKISVLGNVLWDFNARFAEYLPAFLTFSKDTADGPQLVLQQPWQIIFYLTTGLVSLVAVSLLTRPVDGKKLDRFYQCLRTPVGPGEPETEPFTLPPGVEPAPRRLWIDLPGFEIPRPGLIDIAGVAVAAVAAGGVIALVYWIFGLGV